MSRNHNNEEVVVIKKYANRRLYNTETSTYVTLEDLYLMVKEGREFEVVDAKTREDITHQVLTQIIFEEESKGATLMPIKFLRQLIRFYDGSLQPIVPQYLEMMMDAFTQNQEQIKSQSEQFMNSLNPFGGMVGLEQIQKRNMEMFESTMKMFNPFMAQKQQQQETSKKERIDELQEQIKRLNEELKALKN